VRASPQLSSDRFRFFGSIISVEQEECPMSKRDAYVQKFKAQIDLWNAELDKLEAQSRKAAADARIGYEEQIRQLRQQRDKLKGRLAEIKGAGEDAWEGVAQGFEDAWAALKRGVEKAKSQLDD